VNPETVDWLRLARTEAVGAVTFAHLIGRYGSAGAALAALPDLARRGGRAGPLAVPSVREAEAELAAGHALGARLILGSDADFPRLLAALDPPPPLIWTLGDPTLAARRCVAIVGARVASTAGRGFARDLARDLGAAGLVVVSGMARGVDAAAHEGSLEHGAIAVIAGGVDQVYPPENAPIYEAIARRGLLVSERAIGHVARAQDFPRRNRLISGLSLGVIVVEAELRSGSLITARLAGEQGREVFAVPGSPRDPRSKGANELLRQGAWLVEEAEDVLRVLDANVGLREPEPPTAPPVAWEDADGLATRLEALLSATPVTLDALVRDAAASPAAVSAALMELALAGRAELLPGGLAALA
jgi:DNA processing protein